MSKLRDDKILNQLRKGNKEMFHELYLYFPMVRKMIIRSGGSDNDAKDIFQNAIIRFYKKALDPEFYLSTKISTHLYAISQNQFFNLLRKRKKEQVLEIDRQIIDHEIEQVQAQEHSPLFGTVKKLLNELRIPRKDIIIINTYRGYSFDYIAKKMGYRNSKHAKQQKYKHLLRLRKMIPENLINKYYS